MAEAGALTLFPMALPARSRITFRAIDRGVLVRLPHVFWLYKEFRALFPRAKPARRAWTWFVPGRTALVRIGLFERAAGPAVARHLRRLELARRDAEWDALEAPAPVAITYRDSLVQVAAE